MSAIYDRIGVGYAGVRRPDPRIHARVLAALEGCRTVVNVGAGTGSYEPADRWVLGVEPSAEMIRQRAPSAAPCIQATAESLPFVDGSVDAATAFLTIHHWTDRDRGLAEMRRIAKRRVVVFTWLTSFARDYWMNDAYLPEVAALDAGRFPTIEQIEGVIGPVTVHTIPIPHDCADGFYGAYWRRPEAFLDPRVRAGISIFQQIDRPILERALGALARDIDSGAWSARFSHVTNLQDLDLGYRLVVSEGALER